MPEAVAVQKLVVQMPASSISASPIFLPFSSAVNDSDLVYFATGTAASGFYLLGGNFVSGDTVTYNINGTGPITLSVTSTAEAIAALIQSINLHSLTNLVTASMGGPSGDLVVLTANTPGTGGNAITITISTTSLTGEVAASGATLVGGSALGMPGAVSPAPVNVAGGIVGVSQANSTEVWLGNVPPTGVRYPLDVFTQSNVGSGLFPQMSGNLPILALGPPATVIGNVTASTGWISGGAQQVTYGSLVGINKDPVTGYYIFDPTATNLVAAIQDVDNSVNNALTNTFAGQVYQTNPIGVLGIRVKVVFLASALAITQGE